MNWIATLLAMAPHLGSAGACIAYALWTDAFGDEVGHWVIHLHFAQPFVAFLTLAYAASLEGKMSSRKRVLLFAALVAVLGVVGFLVAGDLLLQPAIASVLGWTVLSYAMGVAIPAPDPSLDAARAHALAQDGYELWALVSIFGAVIAAIVAFTVDGARGAWAALIPAAYCLVMAIATAHTRRPGFAQSPKALSDSAFVRMLWRLIPQREPRQSAGS